MLEHINSEDFGIQMLRSGMMKSNERLVGEGWTAETVRWTGRRSRGHVERHVSESPALSKFDFRVLKQHITCHGPIGYEFPM